MRAVVSKRLAGSLGVGAVLLLSACANQDPDGRVGSVGVGTVGGAAGGALLGRAIAGSHNNTLAIATGALLGGIGGNMLVDRPEDKAKAVDAQASKNTDMQRQLDYERQSALQDEQVRNEIQEQRLYNEWKAERGAAVLPPVSHGEIVTAQRLLTAQGLYGGPIDGDAGPGTTKAVMRFQQQQGLTETGEITPTLISLLRATL